VATGGDRPIYSIGAVARMLNIPASTLRAWEERYGRVTPARSPGSQRLYSRSEVEQLRYIKRQIEAGLSAADAHRLLSDELRGGDVRQGIADPAAKAPLLVLIADPDEYATEFTEYFLRTEGWDVATALDATQATLQFEERSPDVVVLDLLISGGAGFRLLGQFAKDAETPVIAVSSIDSGDESLRLGASAFLRKPLEALALVSTVRDLAGVSALVAEERPAPR